MEELVSRVGGLSVLKQRRVAAIVGSLVADAAAQPIHWVYSGMETVLKGFEHPEFRSTSANPFYNIPTGQQSPYGDELIAMLESLVESNGFNADDCAKNLMGKFGPGSPYDNTGPQGYSKGMNDKSIYPIHGKWRNFLLNRFIQYHSAGETLESYLKGSDDANVDPDNIVRLVPLVVLYAGRPEMLKLAEEAALQLQISDMIITVILAACRILESFILDTESGVEDHLKSVIAELKSPSRLHPQPLDRAVASHLQTALDYSTKMDVQSATMKFGKA